MLARTGLTITEHQHRTVDNLLQLRQLWPAECGRCPFVPVLQGWTAQDYQQCAQLYEAAGVRLAEEPIVGLGSVCRRQHTSQIEHLVHALARLGVALHGFGVKTTGLTRYGRLLTSADSLAWSYAGRRTPGCTPSHRNEANCQRFALAWHHRILTRTADRPLTLWDTP